MAVTTKDAAGFIAGGVPEGTMDEKETLAGSYEVLTGFCIGAGKNVWAGEVIELTEPEARRLLGHGWVRRAEAKPAAAAPKPKGGLRDQDPKGIKSQDPK